MKINSNYLKVTVISLIICVFLAVIVYLQWDNSKSSRNFIHMNKNFLQQISDSLPVPEKKIEGEDIVELNNLKGILIYYIEPITEQEAEELVYYFKSEEKNYRGSYIPLSNELTGAFLGNHYYTSILKKLGYGWFSFEGNLYSDYYGREKANEKPNYRNQYRFSFVKDSAIYNIIIFCEQQNPEKSLSAAINYMSTLIE